MSVRTELEQLSRKCDELCRADGWLNRAGVPGYRLLYSSVESFENSNGLLFLGMNPGGTPEDVIPAYHETPFTEPGYSAYLDDQWTQRDRGRFPAHGQSGLQRAVQEVAMLLAGATLDQVLQARLDRTSPPSQRIGTAAVKLLRSAPSGNILPFSHRDGGKLPKRFTGPEGLDIGWGICTIASPRPRVIVTLANSPTGLPISEIRRRSARRGKVVYEHEETVHQGLKRSYREMRLPAGPLQGTLVVGLPALVRDQPDHVMQPLLRVIARRTLTIRAALAS